MAWQSIMPSNRGILALMGGSANRTSDGLGFVQHPLLAPEIISLAFVHQLHCLVSIVRLSAATDTMKLSDLEDYFHERPANKNIRIRCVGNVSPLVTKRPYSTTNMLVTVLTIFAKRLFVTPI